MPLAVLLLAAAASQPAETGKTQAESGLHAEPGSGRVVVLDFPDTAERLAALARENLDAGDTTMALFLAQRALRLQRDLADAAEIAARACLAQQEFGAAEDYARRWLDATGRSAAALMLSARIAFAQGEWERAVAFADATQADKLAPADRAARDELRTLAKAEVAARAELAEKARAARERAFAERTLAEADESPKAAPPPKDVVLYGTTWCGFCARARRWLREHRIAFADKDVERDPDAAQELNRKAAAAGRRASGVPVIDVHGTLVMGFDVPELERLLGTR